MNQIAFIPAGCTQAQSCGVIATPNFLCYASTISLYIHANSEIESYPLLRVLTGPQNSMSSFSLNEDLVACVTPSDKKVFLWEAQTGDAFEQVPTSMFGDLTPIIVEVNPSAVYPSRIAFGCDNGRVVIWDVKDGKSFLVDVGGTRDTIVSAMQWSSQAPHLLAVGTRNGIVSIVDTRTHKVQSDIDCFDALRPSNESLLDRLLHEAPRVSALSFDPLGQTYLLAASTKGFMVLIDIERGNVVQAFDPSPNAFANVAFLRDQPGCFISTDGATSAIQFWNVSSKQSLHSMRPKPEVAAICAVPVPCMLTPEASGLGTTVGPRGSMAFVAFRNGSVALVHLDACKIGLLDTAPGHCETVFDCRFASHDPDIMSSCSYDGTIRIWNVKQMTLSTTITARKAVYCADWSPTGDLILAGLLGGEAAMFSAKSGKELWRTKVLTDVVWRTSWCHREPGIVAVSSRDGTVAVLAAQDGRVLRSYRHSSSVFGIDFDPIGGRVLAAGCYDGKGRLYHLETERTTPVATLSGHEGEISQIVFNKLMPDLVATSSNDRTVRVWAIPTSITALMTAGHTAANVDSVFLQPVMTLNGHTDRTRGLAWHPLCPYLLLSGSWDSTIRLWDTRTGSCIHVGRAHAADVYSISCHPDRPTILVTASRDTTIRFWYLQHISQLYLDAAFGLLRENVVPPSAIKVGGGGTSTDQAQLPCCGPQVQNLISLLDAEQQPHQRLKHIARFFEFPFGGADIVSCASFAATKSLVTIDPNATVAPTDHLASVAITTANAKLSEIRKRRASACGTSVRDQQLKDLASEYLRLGDTRQYCDLLIEAKQFDAAVAAAPAVGVEVWRDACRRASAWYLEQGDYSRGVDYLIVCGESHKAADILASITQFTEAVVVVQACTQATPQAGVAPPLLAEVDARVTANKIVSFARANASRYLAEGSPLLACASLIAADSLEQGVQLVLRSACIPMGHLLFHTLSVSQDLLDFGFSQSLLMSASNKRWRTATIALERLSEPMRLSAAADALAMVVADPSFSPAYKYDVEKALEPFFRAPSNACALTAGFAISLWNVVIQGDANGAAAPGHNTAILDRSAAEIRMAVERLSAPKNGDDGAESLRTAVRALEKCRRWIHYTVDTGHVPVQQKQQVLFFAFLCAALLAKFAFQYEHLVASALRLATSFADSSSASNTALLQATKSLCASSSNSRMDQSFRCLPLGAKLPTWVAHTDRVRKSPLSDKLPRGPTFILENGEATLALQEALEWYRCCWFSPLATSRRILPF